MAANELNGIEKSLLNIYEYLRVKMVDELQRQGHVVNGTLLNSIQGEIVKSTDAISLDGTFVYYGKFVDSGRRRGARKVPIQALENWIIAKGFESDAKKVRGMAFAIQQSIFKKGISTSESWNGESTKNWMTGVLNSSQKKVEDDVYNSVEDALELILFNILKDVESKSTGNTVKFT